MSVDTLCRLRSFAAGSGKKARDKCDTSQAGGRRGASESYRVGIGIDPEAPQKIFLMGPDSLKGPHFHPILGRGHIFGIAVNLG